MLYDTTVPHISACFIQPLGDSVNELLEVWVLDLADRAIHDRVSVENVYLVIVDEN